MALKKAITTIFGIETTYHNVFWHQGIASKEKDEIKAIIRSYVSREAYESGSQYIEQTELGFELQKDFNGQLKSEIYNRAKELEKFEGAEDC